MELKVWSPLLDRQIEWRFDLPRFALSRDLFGFDFRPSIDMVEDEGELVVTTELPGMDPAEIDVSIEEDILTIKGEKTGGDEGLRGRSVPPREELRDVPASNRTPYRDQPGQDECHL